MCKSVNYTPKKGFIEDGRDEIVDWKSLYLLTEKEHKLIDHTILNQNLRDF